jgi:hypothetical protein
MHVFGTKLLVGLKINYSNRVSPLNSIAKTHGKARVYANEINLSSRPSKSYKLPTNAPKFIY